MEKIDEYSTLTETVEDTNKNEEEINILKKEGILYKWWLILLSITSIIVWIIMLFAYQRLYDINPVSNQNQTTEQKYSYPDTINYCIYGRVKALQKDNIDVQIDGKIANMNDGNYFIASYTDKKSVRIEVLRDGKVVENFIVSIDNNSIRKENINLER